MAVDGISTAPAGIAAARGTLVVPRKGKSTHLIGAVIALVVLFVIIAAPVLSPYPPDKISLSARLAAPACSISSAPMRSGAICSHGWSSARASCGIAFAIVIISTVIGSIIGCLSGVVGGIVDTAIMRLMDVFLALPALILAMALAAALGPSLFNAMLAVAVVRVPAYVRLARGANAVAAQPHLCEGIAQLWRLARLSAALAHIAQCAVTHHRAGNA
jgi:peptide/nickel transport system permease protein